MKAVNERMKELRAKLHLSQDYVAKYLNISKSTLNQMENGNRKIFADELSKLRTLFGVTKDSFLDSQRATGFENLDEVDQAEIMNLFKFKERVKAK